MGAAGRIRPEASLAPTPPTARGAPGYAQRGTPRRLIVRRDDTIAEPYRAGGVRRYVRRDMFVTTHRARSQPSSVRLGALAGMAGDVGAAFGGGGSHA